MSMAEPAVPLIINKRLQLVCVVFTPFIASRGKSYLGLGISNGNQPEFSTEQGGSKAILKELLMIEYKCIIQPT